MKLGADLPAMAFPIRPERRASWLALDRVHSRPVTGLSLVSASP
jgi:hypothetical protein